MNNNKISKSLLLLLPFSFFVAFSSSKPEKKFGVTEIATVNNKTKYNLNIYNVQNIGDNVTLLPNSSQNIAIWIPWADNKEQFKSHHVEFQLDSVKRIFYVWQTAGRVRYSTTGWSKKGTAVPGNSEENGKRTVTVTDDNIEFARFR